MEHEQLLLRFSQVIVPTQSKQEIQYNIKNKRDTIYHPHDKQTTFTDTGKQHKTYQIQISNYS